MYNIIYKDTVRSRVEKLMGRYLQIILAGNQIFNRGILFWLLKYIGTHIPFLYPDHII